MATTMIARFTLTCILGGALLSVSCEDQTTARAGIRRAAQNLMHMEPGDAGTLPEIREQAKPVPLDQWCFPDPVFGRSDPRDHVHMDLTSFTSWRTELPHCHFRYKGGALSISFRVRLSATPYGSNVLLGLIAKDQKLPNFLGIQIQTGGGGESEAYGKRTLRLSRSIGVADGNQPHESRGGPPHGTSAQIYRLSLWLHTTYEVRLDYNNDQLKVQLAYPETPIAGQNRSTSLAQEGKPEIYTHSVPTLTHFAKGLPPGEYSFSGFARRTNRDELCAEPVRMELWDLKVAGLQSQDAYSCAAYRYLALPPESSRSGAAKSEAESTDRLPWGEYLIARNVVAAIPEACAYENFSKWGNGRPQRINALHRLLSLGPTALAARHRSLASSDPLSVAAWHVEDLIHLLRTNRLCDDVSYTPGWLRIKTWSYWSVYANTMHLDTKKSEPLKSIYSSLEAELKLLHAGSSHIVDPKTMGMTYLSELLSKAQESKVVVSRLGNAPLTSYSQPKAATSDPKINAARIASTLAMDRFHYATLRFLSNRIQTAKDQDRSSLLKTYAYAPIRLAFLFFQCGAPEKANLLRDLLPFDTSHLGLTEEDQQLLEFLRSRPK